jgi:protein-L-isoaspartate(D-aspartate) O-methyltransferase
MVEGQLRKRGIWDERVLEAMATVPREEFVPRRSRYRAYADGALEIGGGQTISQPWIVAAICQELALQGSERVLEVGTGSGYSAAVLSLLAGEVISVERDPELSRGARRLLVTLGVHNVHLEVGDGSLGDPDRAPFEAIAVHASAPGVPRDLVSQLRDGGRLVVPIAPEDGEEMLVTFHRHGDELTRSDVAPARFVPLIGEGGFSDG